jgi:transcriptional regulator with XRE-family HTH domain
MPTTYTGAQIFAVRTALGETQAEFAARIGVTSTTVSRWETGLRSPSQSLVIAALQRAAKSAARTARGATDQQDERR